MAVKKLIQTLLMRLFNLRLVKDVPPVYSVDCETTIRALLRHHEPKIIFDVGANNGHWAQAVVGLSPSIESIFLLFVEPSQIQ